MQGTAVVNHNTSDELVTIETTEARLSIRQTDGQFDLANRDGSPLIHSISAPWSHGAAGFGAAFSLEEGEKAVGLGDVTRDRLQKRDFQTMMWVCNVESYVPIPFMMSNLGWGMLLNTI
ncbi:MAG: hypothetical protein P1S60_19400 [Anaerolineae bacterium]|nr:hypothetical protein [Anaerolineae bacterium]